MTKTTKRHPASQALVDLRKAMGITQQTLAVEVLKCATTTVSRYESFGPPRGNMLLELRALAKKEKREDIAKVFQQVWLEEVHKLLGAGVQTYVLGEGQSGLLVSSLQGFKEFKTADLYLELREQLSSDNTESQKNAEAAIGLLQTALRRHDPEGAHKMEDAMLDVMVKRGIKATFTAGSPAPTKPRPKK